MATNPDGWFDNCVGQLARAPASHEPRLATRAERHPVPHVRTRASPLDLVVPGGTGAFAAAGDGSLEGNATLPHRHRHDATAGGSRALAGGGEAAGDTFPSGPCDFVALAREPAGQWFGLDTKARRGDEGRRIPARPQGSMHA